MAWVPAHLQRHVLHQRVAGPPTMVKFARRLCYCDNPDLDPTCPLCGREHEDKEHAWRCTRTLSQATRLRD